MKNSSIWRLGTAVLVIGSIIYTARSGQRFSKRREENHDELPEPERLFDKNLITPSDGTFGLVWSTISTGMAALAVHQALPDQEDNGRYQQALPWLAASYGLNAVFGRTFYNSDRESRVASDLITNLNLPLALTLHRQLGIGQTLVTPPEKYLRIPVSLYAGWLTFASIAVDTPNALLSLNWWKPELRRDVPLSIGLLSATSGAGYAIARQLNDPYYLLPFAAGFAGVAVKQYGKHNAIAVAAGTLAVAQVALFAQWVSTQKPKRREVEDTITEADAWEDFPDEEANDEPESYSYTSL